MFQSPQKANDDDVEFIAIAVLETGVTHNYQ